MDGLRCRCLADVVRGILVLRLQKGLTCCPKEISIPSRRHQRFLNLATQVADLSQCRQKHGCIIVKAGNVVAVSTNTFRNNPENVHEDHVTSGCSIHAEANALKKAGAQAKGSTLYVSRVNNQGKVRYSKPCTACHLAISDAGVKNILYTYN